MGVLWGLSLSLAKIGVQAGGHPIGMGLWQVCTSASMLLAFLLIRRRIPVVRPDIIRFGVVCGGCGVAFPSIALFWCALYLPAGIVAIAFASLPLFTYLMSVLLGIEKGQNRRLMGVSVGLGAMMLMIVPEGSLPSPNLTGWVLLALIASVGMSIENTYAGGYRPPNVGSLELSFIRQATAALILFPLAWYFDSMMPLLEIWGTAQWATTATGLLSGIAFTLLLYVINSAGPIFASQTAYIITLAGVGWGMILFGETHSGYIWVALVLTLIGIALVKPIESE
ncbi:MAG: drug/metabolite transporter (DMT)-like permease [Gammaproteobacteria bacterium]|jgi:drug/metabolite transporter (DMT)-like permease